ncbi:hypothetical protein DRO32_03970 [Candidatus Bathyarchaeota archaeon]|nr:MAG: hypothetical protein DRO32_03970 [Candidatus Bathyarchaeota archaeon]
MEDRDVIELEKVHLNGVTKLTFKLTDVQRLEVLVAGVPGTHGSVALMDERVYVFKDREPHEIISELERYARETDPNMVLDDLWGELDLLLESLDLGADVIVRW